MQTPLKNSETFDANTVIDKQQFCVIAKELAHSIDEPALSRAYVQWSRHGNTSEESARSFLATQLPSVAEVILPAAEMQVQNACKWLKSQQLPYRETISGVAVFPTTYDSLRSFIQTSQPLRPIFDRFCANHNVDNTPSAYHQFCRFCGKKIIKMHYHPVHTGYTEFWMRSPTELDDLLRQWAEMTSGIESNVPYSSADIAQHRNSTPISRSDLKSVDSLIESVCKIPVRFRTEVKRAVYAELRGLAIIANHPSQATLYYYVEDEANVTAEICRIVNKLQIRPLSNLKSITGLSFAKLKQHAVDGHIDVRQLESQLFISADEEDRIRELSEQYVSLDEVVNLGVSVNDCSFKLASSTDRNALINHLKVNNMFCAFCVNDPTMPLDPGHMSCFVNRRDVQDLSSQLTLWFRGYKKTADAKLDVLLEEMELRFPRTYDKLRAFIDREHQKRHSQIQKTLTPYIEMVDMLLSCTTRELDELGTEDIKNELIEPNQYNSIVSCNVLADFLVSSNYTTRRYGFALTGFHPNKDSYAIRDYAVIVAHCCNEEIWEESGLIQKAVESKINADMLLYVALHVYSAWRNTDYIRLYEPRLPYTPEDTLEQIRMGTYSTADAERVAEWFLIDLQLRGLKPHKTEKYSNVPNLYFCCPQSCKASFGVILSIAVAHYMLSGCEGSFVRCMFNQGNYRRFFGDVFMQACGNRAFSGRRANKALMQAVETQAREGEQWNSYIAYTLASTLRSHKGGYRTLAETTDAYLRDCNFSGITPEDAVYQMFERGVCSWVVDELLERCYGDEYKTLPVYLKTEAITSLDLTPYHISGLLDAVHTAQDSAIAVVDECVAAGGDVRLAIRRILSGQARTPTGDSDCLLRAMHLNIGCPQSNCTNCRLEIRTITTFARYWAEYCRLKTRTKDMSEFEVRRNSALADKLVPAIIEIQEHYCNDSLGVDELSIRKEVVGGMLCEIQNIYRSRGRGLLDNRATDDN